MVCQPTMSLTYLRSGRARLIFLMLETQSEIDPKENAGEYLQEQADNVRRRGVADVVIAHHRVEDE